MATRVGDESKSSTLSQIPMGFYYYIIPSNKISSATYLGYVDVVESLTYNPYLEEEDVSDVIECPFDSDRYGYPNNTTPKCYRINSFNEVDKELGSIKLFEEKQTEFNTIDPKLQCYPYKYYLVTDYINNPLLVKPQYVYTNDNKLRIRVKTSSINVQSKFNLYAEGYRGDNLGNIEGICNTTSLMLPVVSSAYSQFLATSSASFAQSNINALLENDKTLNQGLANNLATYQINKAKNNSSLATGLIGSLGSLLGGNIGGAVAGAFGTAMNYGLNNEINNMTSVLASNQLNENHQLTEYEVTAMTQAKITDMLNTPNSIKTTGNDTLFNLINSGRKVDIIEYSLSRPAQDRLNNVFFRFGYKYNNYESIRNVMGTRKYFNYVKTSYCNLASAKVPNEYLEEVKQIFNKGVTIWHVDNGATVLDYNVDNVEVY